MKEFVFVKDERLRTNSQIKNVFRQGIPIKGRFLKIYVLDRKDALLTKRAAFLVPKELCNKKAVLRNRFRRIIKEAYRKKKHLFKGSFDIIILALRLKTNTKSSELELDMENVFKNFYSKSY